MKLFYNIIKIIILVFFLILALINTHLVDFAYLPGQHISLPLIVVLFGAFLIGAVFGIFSMFGRLLRLRGENRRLSNEVKKAARLSSEEIAAPVSAVETADSHQ